MTAANTKKRTKLETRLLTIEADKHPVETHHSQFSELPRFLMHGDLLVVNDAATLPASFSGVHMRTGESIEMRLGVSRSSDPSDLSRWTAVFFGSGDWKTPTECRPLPPELKADDLFEFQCGLKACVLKIESNMSSKIAEIEFLGSAPELWDKLYAAGRPVQYSHLHEDLELWDVQTIFSGKPVSLEAPSASFPFHWELVLKLKEKGVNIVALTHAAGLSSIGDAKLDSKLPFPERYWISDTAANAINDAKAQGRRVIAVGTTVTRALESSAIREGIVRTGTEITELRVTPEYRCRIVDGILTGFHENGASHLKLLGSFLEPTEFEMVYHEAESKGYLAHEFGDSCLILR